MGVTKANVGVSRSTGNVHGTGSPREETLKPLLHSKSANNIVKSLQSNATPTGVPKVTAPHSDPDHGIWGSSHSDKGTELHVPLSIVGKSSLKNSSVKETDYAAFPGNKGTPTKNTPTKESTHTSVKVTPTKDMPTIGTTGERNLGELLRALATEELASLTHQILNREKDELETAEETEREDDDGTIEASSSSSSSSTTEKENEEEEGAIIDRDSLESSSSSLPPAAIVGVSRTSDSHHFTPSSRIEPRSVPPTRSHRESGSAHRVDLLTASDSLELVKAELENEKKLVKELEGRVRDGERREEKAKLESSQQIRELRTHLLDAKSKARMCMYSNSGCGLMYNCGFGIMCNCRYELQTVDCKNHKSFCSLY